MQIQLPVPLFSGELRISLFILIQRIPNLY